MIKRYVGRLPLTSHLLHNGHLIPAGHGIASPLSLDWCMQPRPLTAHFAVASIIAL